jgi:tetratricopeptide (TPR) repeat protein
MTIKSYINKQPKFGSGEEVIENCKRAIELEPDNYEAYYWWGEWLSGDGKEQLAKTIDICTEMINNNPQNVHALLHRASARSLIAVYCEDIDEETTIEAIKDFSKVMEIDPLNIEAYDGRAWVQNCSSYGDRMEAIKDYSKIIEIDPKNINAYHNRAKIKAFDVGDFSGAIEDFTRIIEIDANNDEAYMDRARVKENRVWGANNHDISGAIEDYSKAIEINPNNDSYYCGRGSAKEELHLYQEAIEDYSKAIEINPDDYAYCCRGGAKSKLHFYQEAIEDYVKGLELDYDMDNDVLHPLFYTELGRIRCKVNDYKNAIEDFTKALELYPYYAEAFAARGNVKQLLNDYKGAIEDYVHAIELTDYYRIDEFNDGMAALINIIENTSQHDLYAQCAIVKNYLNNNKTDEKPI